MKPKILVILGPTATGKSGLAFNLALEFDGEVISADSRQVYKGLDVGTGKITKEEMRGIPHHLLDVVRPGEEFNVTHFKKLAGEEIEEIIKRDRLPILAGGSGFYIQAIVDGVVPPEVPPDENLRKDLSRMTADELFEKLKELDPKRANSIEKENPRRLIRAIEIAKKIGEVPEVRKERRYDSLQIGLDAPDKILRDRIDRRLEKRLKNGMLEEGKMLTEKRLDEGIIKELGFDYIYAMKFLNAKISREKMVEEIRNKEWQYAKKQRTWFRKDERIKWFKTPLSSGDKGKICKITEEFLNGSD